MYSSGNGAAKRDLDTEYSPFASRKVASTSEEVQQAWVTINVSLRRAAVAPFLTATGLCLACVKVYNSSTEGRNALGTSLAASVNKSLAVGTVLFFGLAVVLWCTYPKANTYPPRHVGQRLQVARVLLLFLGAGYLARGVTVLRESHWQTYFGTLGSALGANGAMPEMDPPNAWRLGSEVGLLVCGVGFASVLASYYCGWQAKALKDAMRHTKTLRSKAH